MIIESVAALVLAALLAPSAWGKLTRDDRQVNGMRAVGFPVSMMWLLAAAEVAAIAGLALGLLWRPLGVAASIGLIGYFVGALAFLLRARVTKAAALVPAGAFLVLAAAVLWLDVLAS
jgi:hypothetical protein